MPFPKDRLQDNTYVFVALLLANLLEPLTLLVEIPFQSVRVVLLHLQDDGIP